METRIVCCRMSDPYRVPLKGAVTMPCQLCGEPCQVADDTAEFQAVTGVPIWCLVCWAARRHPEDITLRLPSCDRADTFKPTSN